MVGASSDLSNFRSLCVSQVRTFFLFGLWLRKRLEPKKIEISMRCDLAAFSSGLLSARAGPTLTVVPGTMLA